MDFFIFIKMKFNIRMITSYPPEICGIGTYSQELITELQKFTGEVSSINIAAIDRSRGRIVYHAPVDLVIDQFNPESWYLNSEISLVRAYEKSEPTAIIMQHEFGLSGECAQGNDYQNLARHFQTAGPKIITLANLHTVLRNPNSHQKNVIQELGRYVDGIIVPTKKAIEILSSDTYSIPLAKLKHIDHGIRIKDFSSLDQQKIKKEYGLEGILLISTPGLKSLDKGIDYGIEAYGRMLGRCFSKDSPEKRKLNYVIAGSYHPNFIRDYREAYEKSEKRIQEAVKRTGLKSTTTDDIRRLSRREIEENDVIFLDTYMSETFLRDFYAASDVILLPYRNIQQMCSGILADAVGFGKSIITTKFPHAVELIAGGEVKGGLIGRDIRSRGVLVDLTGKYKNKPSIEQLTEGLESLVFNADLRAKIGMNARKRGHEMKWENVTWDLVQYISSLLESKIIQKREQIKLNRDK